MKLKYLLLLPITALLFFANCTKDNEEPEQNPPAAEKVLIGEEYALGTGLKVQYYADEDLFVGYNKVYLTLRDSISDEVVSNDIDASFMPMMEMNSGMMHSCPKEDLSLNSSTNQFEGAVVYVMASMAGDWMFTVNLTDNNSGLSGEASFDVMVSNPDVPRLFSFISDLDSTASYFVSIIQPQDPKVGENNFEIIINRRASMMSWPYEPYLATEIEPWMPAMNHGSPNNVNPIHIENGHYRGVANFTMTGFWRVYIVIKDGEGNILNDSSENSYFDLTF